MMDSHVEMKIKLHKDIYYLKRIFSERQIGRNTIRSSIRKIA